MRQVEYWSKTDGSDGKECKLVKGMAKGHTWLAHDTHNIVESFISIYLDDKYHLFESDVKNFNKSMKTKSVYDASLKVSSVIKVIYNNYIKIYYMYNTNYGSGSKRCVGWST